MLSKNLLLCQKRNRQNQRLVDPSIEANRLAKQKKDAADAAEREQKEEERQKQLALQQKIKQYETAQGFLRTAAARANSGIKQEALDNLKYAANISGLPQSVIDKINSAKAMVGGENYKETAPFIMSIAKMLNNPN